MTLPLQTRLAARTRTALLLLVAITGSTGAAVALATHDSPHGSPGRSMTTIAPVVEAARSDRVGDADGEETWQQGLDRIVRAQNAAFNDPATADLDTTMDPTCTCTANLRGQVDELRRRGLHVAGDNLTLRRPTLTSQRADGKVEVHGYVASVPYTVVDAKGDAVASIPQTEEREVLLTLSRGPRGQWRIADERFPLPSGAQGRTG